MDAGDRPQPRRRLELIPLELLDPDPAQPRRRRDPDHVRRLAASIREHGVLEPILVVPENGRYRIVAGETRYRAAREAGLSEIPALIEESPKDTEALALVENLARADLRRGELALALVRYLTEHGFPREELREKARRIARKLQKGQRGFTPDEEALLEAVRSLGLAPQTTFRYLIPLGLLPEATVLALDDLDLSLRELDRFLRRSPEDLAAVHRHAEQFGSLDRSLVLPRKEKPPKTLYDRYRELRKAARRFQELATVEGDPEIQKKSEELLRLLEELEAALYRERRRSPYS